MQITPGQLLYSRYSDGARPVRVLDKGYEVVGGPKEKSKVFLTRQGLLAELTGHPTGRHWSMERYFRGEEPGGGVLDLFGEVDEVPLPMLIPLVTPLITLRFSPAISIPASLPGLGDRSLVVAGPVGIDLLTRSHEVRKLLFAGFGRRIYAGGYNPDDVLQEVYRGLLVRNRGKCPWDPSKGTFGHYVHMVCGCVFSNIGRKQRRRDQMEQVGLPTIQDGELREGDVASSNVPAPETMASKGSSINEAALDLTRFMRDTAAPGEPVSLAITILPHVHAGEARKDIAAAVGVSMPALSRAISYLRRTSLQWRENLGESPSIRL